MEKSAEDTVVMREVFAVLKVHFTFDCCFVVVAYFCQCIAKLHAANGFLLAEIGYVAV